MSNEEDIFPTDSLWELPHLIDRQCNQMKYTYYIPIMMGI